MIGVVGTRIAVEVGCLIQPLRFRCLVSLIVGICAVPAVGDARRSAGIATRTSPTQHQPPNTPFRLLRSQPSGHHPWERCRTGRTWNQPSSRNRHQPSTSISVMGACVFSKSMPLPSSDDSRHRSESCSTLGCNDLYLPELMSKKCDAVAA